MEQIRSLDIPTVQGCWDEDIVGVGNVGREPGRAIYTLYSPYSDRLKFKTINYFALPGSESTFRAIFR